MPSSPLRTFDECQKALRAFKELLAKRLWTLPNVSEAEKEIVYSQYLTDLDAFEKEVMSFYNEATARQKKDADENELLRSLMGVSPDDLKAKVLNKDHELISAKEKIKELEDEVEVLKKLKADAGTENEFLRKRIRELEEKKEQSVAMQYRLRENDLKRFAESHDGLKNELKDLEFRLANLRELFVENNKQIVKEKQDEITTLQKNLLDEMEKTLRHRQELAWTEEELFAKGVANKVRTALVSAQGKLLLTLERIGLLEPESSSESFWKARLKLLVEGGHELTKNFIGVQTALQDVTRTLDDYLHLTGRKAIIREMVLMKDIVQKEIAELYVDRQPTLSVEFLPEDPLPSIEGDPELLSFVVRVLLQNAVEALPNKTGRILISLKTDAPKEHVRLVIDDSGAGIPSHLQERLFEPFFSTKDGRQGLNLNRARRYVELHGGTLELVRSGTDGSTFEAALPLKKAA